MDSGTRYSITFSLIEPDVVRRAFHESGDELVGLVANLGAGRRGPCFRRAVYLLGEKRAQERAAGRQQTSQEVIQNLFRRYLQKKKVRQLENPQPREGCHSNPATHCIGNRHNTRAYWWPKHELEGAHRGGAMNSVSQA